MFQMQKIIAVLAWAILCGWALPGQAGGELPSGAKQVCEPQREPRMAHKKIGPPAGTYAVEREAPLPVPKRHVGQGFSLHDDYGPTYYYPANYNRYEGLNPKYYPFYAPRLWPNYKAEAKRPRGHYCGTSRSGWYWDEYDDWVRGGRYEERAE